jgi:hypothetical protein
MFLRTVGIIMAAFTLSGCSNDSSETTRTTADKGAATAEGLVAAKNPLELPEGVIGAENITAYVHAASAAPKGDEFTKGFDDKPLGGRTFKVTVPYDKYNSSLHYHYDSEHEKLYIDVRLDSTFHRGDESNLKLNYVILTKTSNYGSPRPMSNAFGLTKNVTPVSHAVIGLGNERGTYIGVFPKDKISSKDYIFYQGLGKEIKISPEEGRAAVAGLEMDIEGTIVAGERKHPIVCKKTESKAEIDYTYQETWDECIVSVKLTRIAVHSPKLGTIAEWSAPVTTLERRKKS